MAVTVCVPAAVAEFLNAETPDAWLDEASGRLSALLLDLLLVGALIEARSCERFAKIAQRLPQRLGRFYAGLLASEARPLEHYIALARTESAIDDQDIDSRRDECKALEESVLLDPDLEIRVHARTPA